MYQSHPDFTFPSNPDTPIWRYIDITKLLSMFESQSLFFTRIDCLGDPFEGAYTRSTFSYDDKTWIEYQRRRNFGIPIEEYGAFDNMGSRPIEQERELMQKLQVDPVAFLNFQLKTLAMMRKQNFANCWHMNETESMAMWKLYLKSDEGIAIKSTANRLRESLSEAPEPLNIGTVDYINYDEHTFKEPYFFQYILHKRKSFEHERELRAVLWGDMSEAFRRNNKITGISVHCDLNRLIEEIWIAPMSPLWIADLVRAIVRRYGFSFPVEQSVLLRPLYD